MLMSDPEHDIHTVKFAYCQEISNGDIDTPVHWLILPVFYISIQFVASPATAD